MAKQKTYEQAESGQRKAVNFAANVLEDDDLADELESLSVEDYAERKGWEIKQNPEKGKTLMTSQQLKDELEALRDENERLLEENEELSEKLDAIGGIIGDDSDDEELDSEDSEDEDLESEELETEESDSDEH